MTEPTETYDGGGAMWEADPFEVSAEPQGVNPAVVVVDGRIVSPATARALSRVLAAAADRAEGR